MTLGPYAAANAALDAYVVAARRAGRGRWLSVDWDTWGVDRDRVSGHSADVADFAMTVPEAVDVFERTLALGAQVSRLVVSTGPIEPRVRQWVLDDLHAVGADQDTGERHPRPDLSTPFVEPSAGTQARLAGIWSAVLAVAPIGAHDSFFELGGHSLLAIELTHRIRRALDVPLPVTGLLQAPSVAELAAVIDGAGRDPRGT